MVIGIIEDDKLLRKALDTSLKNQGYTTILAASRKEAIKNIDSSVDLLIVDIGLPDGDGINLYQELQKNRKIPAIFLTAKDEATAKLSRGDFTTRLNIKYPPEFIVLSKNFNLMAEELGSMEVLRTDFINNFSHEFKTPIISIKGFAEILKDDTLSKEERDEYLDIIIEESQRLSYLATNVLNLSKIEGQAILKDKQKFNVGEQIRQNILLLEPKFKDKNISLNIDIDDCILIGNKEMLSHVWLNLLGNSIKFINDNGVIRVIVKKRDDNIIMIFSDNGIGISENVIPKIFDKFYQGDTSHATKGNGLGLTMVKKIVELHSGTIKCESVLSKGTKFTITLPIE